MDESETNRCFTCNKVGTVAVPLRRCSRCHLTRYCGRDCQQTDWFRHKRSCPRPLPEPSGPQRLDLDLHLFGRSTGTRWLYDRTETMTYKLLTDSYRMNVWFHSESSRVEGPLPCGEEKFREFLLRAREHPSQPLPPWWTSEEAERCVEFAKPSLDLGTEGFGPEITTVKVWAEMSIFVALVGWK
ncbi:MYND domain protein [Penicillium malachiteum]|uniref:MYND domain protein n=1 Tax=Penicillium malachiteum TaxID=1324776 RepID=UPI00254798E1|nr:MYND domain protein [Penicillium malachiteum]KAJ5713462.1 MYND domain protein [Penicillium malachiteum]